ncbi:hypothetical protein AAVH_28927 [Aphelenchoides avenae]|nr:hypothetical protein AAVH_28927 [Aphelenchus avenae]
MDWTTGEQDLEALFHRTNNAFVHRLALSFDEGNSLLLDCLQANTDELQCQVQILATVGVDVEIDIDDALVIFVGTHLAPQIYHTSMFEFRADYAMLFAHAALRGSIQHLKHELHYHPAPDCIIPQLFGVHVLETCAMTTGVDPRPWICKFVKRFENAEAGTDMVRSVVLLHQRFGLVSPVHHDVDPLGRPRRTDVPKPHCDFMKEWYRGARLDSYTITESTVAELFVFENAQAAKKLDVFVWTVNEECQDEEENSLSYVFLLRVVDM